MFIFNFLHLSNGSKAEKCNLNKYPHKKVVVVIDSVLCDQIKIILL
jgi:hypothetical protein